jgi:hypothetical protein
LAFTTPDDGRGLFDPDLDLGFLAEPFDSFFFGGFELPERERGLILPVFGGVAFLMMESSSRIVSSGNFCGCSISP